MLQLLINARLYAPQPLGVQQLLIGAGRILWLGERIPDLDDALEVDIQDLDGGRLIPGLIDAHAHLTGGGGEAGFASRVPPPPLSHYTRAGVTTVVGLLGTDDITRNTAALLAQVRGLEQEGITAFCHTGGYHLPPTPLTGSVTGDI
ncbi:MAG: beta-aspartyl-peptidase, partial [Candidatus Competibacteraceae bacterium]|nr:beta-aspartyl-peptidase [Candidatus Competibacteraceae bacterium]